MGKINEITQKVEQSFGSNKYTTEIKDDIVEFDSNGLAFVFLDPVNVPSLSINGEEIGQNEQVQSDWAETEETAAGYILNRPAIRTGGGTNAIIEGDLTKNIATGDYSHAEGSETTASGPCSHAEGQLTTATGNYSHAEGKQTTASGYYSHAEGNRTTATSDYSHAEGNTTTATGNYSHAEGFKTTASSYSSHAEGYETTANHRSQHVFGEYNIADTSPNQFFTRGNYVEIVGNGADNIHRSNARTLDFQGNEVLAGTITANGVNLSEAISTVKLRVNGGSLQASVDGGISWHTITFAD